MLDRLKEVSEAGHLTSYWARSVHQYSALIKKAFDLDPGMGEERHCFASLFFSI